MNLADPEVLRPFLQRHGLSARKNLGQHFLCSPTAVEAIVAAASGSRGILEIGPGPGVLTAALSETFQAVTALEIDSSLKGALAESAPKAQVLFDDALKTDLSQVLEELPEPRAVVSNLPYYITAPLVSRIADARAHYSVAVLMMQSEVADRIVAEPGNGDRGSLSVYLQALFEIRRVVSVPASGFLPPPKVDSQVLAFRPFASTTDPETFFTFVRQGFSHPRKTLANNLTGYGKGRVLEALEGADLKASVRPHEIKLDQWRALFAQLMINTQL